MVAPVDICNLALSNLGDDAQVASIDPPDQTTQGILCGRFYPIARDMLLEKHPWGFATKRVQLAQLNATVPATPAWQYAYALPSDFLGAIAVQDALASGDTLAPSSLPPSAYIQGMSSIMLQQTASVVQDFVVEANANDGSGILYTNQPTALLRYTYVAEDSERYSPSFVAALSWLLAAMLAGPIIKGAEGRKAAADARAMADYLGKQAMAADAGDRHITLDAPVSWMANR